MTDVARHEVCAIALAETFRGDAEILASPIGVLPTIAARLAKLTFAPDLLLTDGVSGLLASVPALGAESTAAIEGYLPYRSVFDAVWSGRRHVVMGAAQLDRFGNQNIALIGNPQRPKAQLLGMRGAPGNTINHTTSYFVPKHDRRVFVERVDVVSGLGYDRAAALGARAARYHCIRRVVSNFGVFDFDSPERSMRLVSVHPEVSVDQVVAATGFALVIPADVPITRHPSDEELRLIREHIDPQGRGKQEIAA
jgi:acyl CoA:acetate/3-ketoacid CoA transferase beta subunit